MYQPQIRENKNDLENIVKCVFTCLFTLVISDLKEGPYATSKTFLLLGGACFMMSSNIPSGPSYGVYIP